MLPPEVKVESVNLLVEAKVLFQTSAASEPKAVKVREPLPQTAVAISETSVPKEVKVLAGEDQTAEAKVVVP